MPSAWIFGLIILILCALDVALIYLNLEEVPLSAAWGFRGFQVVLGIPLSILGSLVAYRRPRNPIGWLFLLSAGLGLISEMAGEYAYYAVLTQPGSLPSPGIASWLSAWVWAPGTAAFLIFSFLYFPDGELLSQKWRSLVWISIGSILVLSFIFAFVPGSSQLTGIENTFTIQVLAIDQALFVVFPLILLLIPASLAVLSLFIRFRRAQGIERQQMKWFFITAAFAPLAIIIGSFQGLWTIPLLVIIIAGVPTSMAIAILRYRLYSIDVIINRTLVYGALTGTLALVYFGSIVLLQRILPAQTQLATVLSTLAVAALFAPLRRRIQRDIDRLFYRSKYNAEQTLAAFNATAREEVDLNRLSESLLAIVDETMQPALVSLWIRPSPLSSLSLPSTAGLQPSAQDQGRVGKKY
jgi:hypothetical protein